MTIIRRQSSRHLDMGEMSSVVMVVDAAPPLYGGAGRQALLLSETVAATTRLEFEVWSRQKEAVKDTRVGRVRFLGPHIRNQFASNLLFSLICGLKVLVGPRRIVHVHGAFYYGFFAILAARIRRFPSILKVTLVGADDPATVRRLRKIGLPLGRLIVRQFDWANQIIALNEETRCMVLDRVPAGRVAVIPNGIEILDAVRDRSGDRAPRVVFTGVLSRRKGVDTLLGAWPQFKEVYPDARMDLFGPITHEISAILGSGLAGVVAHGTVDSSVVKRALDEANLFVLPSRAEGLPNALIEAMGAGLPVVVGDIPVSRETAGHAAVYCDPESVGSIAEAMKECWANRARMADLSREQALAYDIREVAMAYRELYARLSRIGGKE